MSTRKWSDDDLDGFFKKSSEEADPAYNPPAWQDLNNRLNDHNPTRFYSKWLRWFLPALLLLVSTGILVWYITALKIASNASTNVRPAKSASVTPPQRLVVSASLPSNSTLHRLAPKSLYRSTTDRRQQIFNRTLPNHPIEQASNTNQVTDTLMAHQPVSLDGRLVTPHGVAKAFTKHEPSASHFNAKGTKRGRLPEYHTESIRMTDRSFRMRTPVNSPMMAGTLTDPVIGGLPITQTNLVKVRGNKQPFNGTTDAKNSPLISGRSKYLADSVCRAAKPSGLAHQASSLTSVKTGQIENENTLPASSSGESYDYMFKVITNTRPVITENDRAFFQWPEINLLAIKSVKWPLLPASNVVPPQPENIGSVLKPTHPPFSNLSIQLSLSPDLSTIGLRNFDRPGSNLGVLVQYQLSNRFSLQTGALWSTKVYKTVPSEYTSPVYMHVLPESLAGKYTLVDIPLNLRYDVLVRPGEAAKGFKHWFVSGGFSSYFIDREVYNFTFMNPDDPTITAKGWDTKDSGLKGGNFSLSNLNFSVGYEQSISRRLSWQLEPFMKVPLKQVSYFKVKLLSTGVFMSLRYHL